MHECTIKYRLIPNMSTKFTLYCGSKSKSYNNWNQAVLSCMQRNKKQCHWKRIFKEMNRKPWRFCKNMLYELKCQKKLPNTIHVKNTCSEHPVCPNIEHNHTRVRTEGKLDNFRACPWNWKRIQTNSMFISAKKLTLRMEWSNKILIDYVIKVPVCEQYVPTMLRYPNERLCV